MNPDLTREATTPADLDTTVLMDMRALLPAGLEQPGDMIGRYKLIEPLGQGGFGSVWRAEQSEAIRREVALKLIKAGMDSREIIVRFEAERQALALMDHPNIASVLDAGTTDGGRPFFAMELVKGIPITDYCDAHQLTIRQRLELFIPVCQAVQHAHQKAILHRDLKPSNILVAEVDGKPVPKVIDFGIAKALGTSPEAVLQSSLLQTQAGAVIGTPQYMSPEQAGAAPDLDTRSDIYTLGIILYELLTGDTPLSRDSLRKAALDEVLRLVREADPKRPSSRVLPVTDLAKHASTSRQTEPAKLARTLSGDLDWIALKALEKERDRRYGSAAAFAQDLERYLKNEPVEAGPPSPVYRFRKLVQRNRLVVGSAATMLVLLLAGIAFSTWQAVRATKAEHLAEQRRETAEARAETISQNLYFAEMKSAADAAEARDGLSFMNELTEKWWPAKGDTDRRGWEWFYLDSLRHRALLTFSRLKYSGPSNFVLLAAWNPDGTLLASSHANGEIKIWNPFVGKEPQILNGSGSLIGETDRTILVSGRAYGEIKIWDPFDDKEIQTLKGGHTRIRGPIIWSPEGRRIAFAVADSTVRVLDVKTGKEQLILKGHTSVPWSVAWNPDETRLASYGADGIKVWDAKSGKQTFSEKITTFSDPFLGRPISWHPDGSQLAVGDGYHVVIWDVVKCKWIRTLNFMGAACLAWNANGTRLAAGTSSGTVKVHETRKNGDISYERQVHSERVHSVAWSPDGRFLATSSADRTIKLLLVARAQDVELVSTLRGHNGEVGSVSWNPDGTHLASIGGTMMAKVWDARSLDCIGNSKNGATSIDWSPDDKRLLSASDFGQHVKLWRMDKKEEDLTLEKPVTGKKEEVALEGRAVTLNAVWDAVWSPDGKRVASGHHDGTLIMWDATNGKEILSIHAYDEAVRCLAWSPDGKRIATSGSGIPAKVWDATTGKELRTLKGGGALAWSPDGQWIATEAEARGGGIKILDMVSDGAARELHGPSNISMLGSEINALSWSPDSKRVAGARHDGTVSVWDVVKEEVIQILRGHGGPVKAVSWSPDGHRLASGGDDLTVRVWDVKSGTQVVAFGNQPGRYVADVAWSHDGQKLASAANSGLIRIWDASKSYALERTRNQR